MNPKRIYIYSIATLLLLPCQPWFKRIFIQDNQQAISLRVALQQHVSLSFARYCVGHEKLL